jgi:hypothetical protein
MYKRNVVPNVEFPSSQCNGNTTNKDENVNTSNNGQILTQQ